jgi:hypothetical protein
MHCFIHPHNPQNKLKPNVWQDIRNFSTLLVGDAASVSPSAENMPSYSAAFANSACEDYSYSCALTNPVDFVSYSMN